MALKTTAYAVSDTPTCMGTNRKTIPITFTDASISAGNAACQTGRGS
jgi:hypothetical protein